ncbi:MAG: PmoA family protein [Bacteroidales bacterium]
MQFSPIAPGMIKKAFLTMVCAVLFLTCAAQKITITVQAGDYEREDCVVSADVSKLNPTAASVITLYEQMPDGKRETASQLYFIKGGTPVLFWILDGKTAAGSTRTFIAETKGKKPAGAAMDIEDTQKALVLKKDGLPVLQYNYARLDPPPGADAAYGRTGGYIHPAYSPAGNILTHIQPRDHYHHFGIWNPWTRVIYDGKLYDLWNIGDKTGTVRARSVEDTHKGAVFSGFTALLDHYIFNEGAEQVIMNEYWKVKTWNIAGGAFLWDFESHLLPSTSLPVLIQAYRYAGFGWRGTPEWTKENCVMLTSEGKTRPEIDGTNARWIYVTGTTQTGRSGLLFMGHPANYNFPEPLRIWDQNANSGRGDAFINFAPTKNKDWELQPGGHYILKYRILAFEGDMTTERANRLWNDFACPPAVTIQ